MLQTSPNQSLTEFPISREVILAMEQAIQGAIADGSSPDLTSDIPLDHQFASGLYARGMKVAAGTLLVGKIHRKTHFIFLLSGDCVVLDEGGRKDLRAPFFYVANPGAKRVIYAVSDLVWYNVHGTAQTDLDAIEAELIAPNYADLTAVADAIEVEG